MKYQNPRPHLYNLHKGKAPVVQTIQTSFIIFVQNIENKKNHQKIYKNLLTNKKSLFFALYRKKYLKHRFIHV
jgi:hypothetical protein